MSISNVPLVILCGGKGTRMGGLSELTPKPLLRVGKYPMLWHVMKLYSHFNVKDFILALGYKGWEIKNYFLRHKDIHNDFTLDLAKQAVSYRSEPTLEDAWKITFADTGEESLTGLRIFKIRKYIEESKAPYFYVTYGDGIGNIDIEQLTKFHLSHGKVATVTGVSPPSRFGELIMKGNQVTLFNEKPQVSGGYINGGFFVFNTQTIWDFIDDKNIPLEIEPLKALAKAGQLMAFRHEGFWQPMDTQRELELLNSLWNSGNCPWDINKK